MIGPCLWVGRARLKNSMWGLRARADHVYGLRMLNTWGDSCLSGPLKPGISCPVWNIQHAQEQHPAFSSAHKLLAPGLVSKCSNAIHGTNQTEHVKLPYDMLASVTRLRVLLLGVGPSVPR